MTARTRTIVVTLERDMREDDAESLVRAIEQLRGVGRCELSQRVDLGLLAARLAEAKDLADVVERATRDFFTDRYMQGGVKK